jgi:hypothetical protein
MLPPLGKIINDQTGIQTLPETQEQMVERYRKEL